MIEEILTITVHCLPARVVTGRKHTICMIPFTGEAAGPYFTGEVLGQGVDTQRYPAGGGPGTLSARYMLEGRDYTGAACRIFIENNGSDLEHCTPTIITDSQALSHWENAPLSARVVPREEVVEVHIYLDTRIK